MSSVRRRIGDDISYVGRDADWRGEFGLLPTGSCFACESYSPQLLAGAGPKSADMSSYISRSFIKSNTSNITRNTCVKLQPDRNGSGVGYLRHLWRRITRPN